MSARPRKLIRRPSRLTGRPQDLTGRPCDANAIVQKLAKMQSLQGFSIYTTRALQQYICMLDRSDFEPVFFAPFVSSVMSVDPKWIDLNGHMNMAYYHVLFDRGVDEMYSLAGIGWDYLKTRNHSFFTAEVHLRYLRELHEGDPVRVTFQLLDTDAKRLHFFQQIFHATEGWVSATCENLSLHIDMAARKVAPFPPDVVKRLCEIKKSHGRLPRPEAVGRRIAMPAKS
jgi:acyl-CoA thioester hydrolase